MGASASKKPNRQPEPEINVTPLVDVVLVLLIIFMVVTPAINEGENVELPSITNVDKNKNVEPLDVTLAPDGTVIVGKQRIDASALTAKLKEAYDLDPARKVLLKADSNMPYADVRRAFVMAQDVGFRGVSLKVVLRDKEGAS